MFTAAWAIGALTLGPSFLIGIRRMWRAHRLLSGRRLPLFLSDKGSHDGHWGIPVFTYHSVAGPDVPDSVTPAEFEIHMRYLAENGYHTITADELFSYMTEKEPVPERSVVLTFDDGRASLWTTAFPVLRRYGHRAVAFLVPGIMTEGGIRAEDCPGEDRSARISNPLKADMGPTPCVSWEETLRMARSGLLDLQSHTMEHSLIPISPEIVDFINPSFDPGFAERDLPLSRWRESHPDAGTSTFGAPVYRSGSRMGPARRFLDDPRLSEKCVDHVASCGGKRFFTRTGWREELQDVAREFRRKERLQEEFETAEDQEQAIGHSLRESKQLMESRLEGHRVRHLCYPWHRYGMLAARLAQEAGFVSAFIDINPHKLHPHRNDPYAVQRRIPLNEWGDDPFQVTRIDARDNMILGLPGKGRMTWTRRFLKEVVRPPAWWGNRR